MPRYEISLAYNVPFYARFEVEAESENEAIQRALKEAEDTAFTPEWDGAHCGEDVGADSYINENYRLVDAFEIAGDSLREVKDHIKRNPDAFDPV